jgi:ribosomal protein L21E
MLLIALAALCAVGAKAQDANLKREVMFTLGKDERIVSREYFALQHLEGYRYACIIENDRTKNGTFIFNGKRMSTGSFLPDIYYLNVHEEYGYVFLRELGGKYGLQTYLNIKGNEYYFPERSFPTFAKDSEGNTDFYKFYYNCYSNGKYVYRVFLDGEDEGPFDDVRFPVKREPGRQFIYALDGKWYSRYSDGSSKELAESPVFASEHRKDVMERYVTINGRDSKVYNEIRELQTTDNGKYAYMYREGDKWHVMINVDGTEKSSKGYDDRVWGLKITESGKYIYEYKEGDKWHVMLNIDGTEKSSRAYSSVSDLRLTESGQYAYAYYENGTRNVNLNGKEIITKDGNVTRLEIDDQGNYTYYSARDDGKIYKNSNGEESESAYLAGMDYDGLHFFGNWSIWGDGKIKIYSADRKHTLESEITYEQVVIDGKRTTIDGREVIIDGQKHGHSPALYAWYDPDKNAFIWNALEDRDFVVYEYKLGR